jgi:hypothetical protein
MARKKRSQQINPAPSVKSRAPQPAKYQYSQEEMIEVLKSIQATKGADKGRKVSLSKEKRGSVAESTGVSLQCRVCHSRLSPL